MEKTSYLINTKQGNMKLVENYNAYTNEKCNKDIFPVNNREMFPKYFTGHERAIVPITFF